MSTEHIMLYAASLWLIGVLLLYMLPTLVYLNRAGRVPTVFWVVNLLLGWFFFIYIYLMLVAMGSELKD